MSGARRETQLAVVGGGPGGYTAAFRAAELGLEVTLVDDAPLLGGVCLRQGCIPSKALLHVAKLREEARAAESFGLRFGEPELDLARLRDWKGSVLEKLAGGLDQLARQREVRTLRGRARFEDARSLRVETGDGEETLRFEHAIVATGSRPASLPGLPEDSVLVLDSTAALALDAVPERLLVVGGGYIGLELGSVYAALGSRVTLIEMTASLLPGVDPDLVRPLARRLGDVFDEIALDTRLGEVREQGHTLYAALGEDGREAEFDAVLVAVGRRPRTDALGLDRTKVRVAKDGTLRVDEARRTDEPSVFAVGDVTGEPMLAHKAFHEGRVAAEVCAGRAVAFEPRAIPAVVFTDPEVAWCGLTERDAGERGIEVAVGRFPWSASGRAATLGRSDGVTKLVVDPRSERLLGVGVTGPGAGELVAEGVLALEMGARVTDLALSIHPHPTLSETLQEAAEAWLRRQGENSRGKQERKCRR